MFAIFSARNFLISGSSGMLMDDLYRSEPSFMVYPRLREMNSVVPVSLTAFFRAISRKLFFPKGTLSELTTSNLTLRSFYLSSLMVITSFDGL